MKLSKRDTWLAVIIVVVLVGLSIVAGLQQMSAAEPPMLSTGSSAPGGGKALMLWLDELGYAVRSDFPDGFSIPDEVGTLLILEPLSQQPLLDQEWAAIDKWVDQGGTLIVAGDNYGANQVFQHFDFGIGYSGELVETQPVYTPLLSSPPMSAPITANTNRFLMSDQANYVTLVASEEGPLAVAFGQEQGLVILTTLTYPFTNRGLKDSGNPDFILNLISAIDPDGIILFDEWHHGYGSTEVEVRGPLEWLKRTPIGRAVLFSAAVIFVGVALSGRQFGKPVPLKQDVSKRSQLEYISAVANLRRRAHQRQYTLMTYHKNIKRELGKRYRLDPDLDDEEYIARLSVYNPSLDTDALRELLNRLRQKNVNETTMVQLAAEAAEWLNYYKR